MGSVAGDSFVSLTPIEKGWTLGYEEASFKDIELSEGSLVDASGITGGLGTQENENKTLKVNTFW